MKKLQRLTIALVMAMSLSTVAFAQTDEDTDNENHGGRVVRPVETKYSESMLSTLETVVKALKASGLYLAGL